MYAAPGIGLAAPQVGVLFEYSSSTSQSAAIRKGLMVMINPEIVGGTAVQLEEEGCLSVPDLTTVVRAAQWSSRDADRSWTESSTEGAGLMARAFQHELDHLTARCSSIGCGASAGSHRSKDSEAFQGRQMVTSSALRVVFFGTPQFAVPTLDALLEVPPPGRWRRDAARSAERPGPRDDDRTGQRRWLSRQPSDSAPERLREASFLPDLKAFAADLAVAAAYGKF
jgi:hypothetical protein